MSQCMPALCPGGYTTLALSYVQVSNTAAAEVALQHAWAALDQGMHKLRAGDDGQSVPPFLRRFHAGEGRASLLLRSHALVDSAPHHTACADMCCTQGGCSA